MSNKQIKEIVDAADKIVVIQADNPDADSLGSALALEQILGEMGKKVFLYCSVDMPGYLKYLKGWDRVNSDLPPQFDASIIVDASTLTLLEKLISDGKRGWLASKPCVVLDHHGSVDNSIDFAKVTLNKPELSSTGELIFRLAQELQWPLDETSGEYIMTAILGDTQGLTNNLAKAETYQVMASLVEIGVNRPQLEESRRELSKMPPEIFKYKADLISRTELSAGGRLAIVTVPQKEINEFSPLYNPAPLVQPDMLQTVGVEVAVVLKNYDDGRITGAIRCNTPVGDKLAEHFGGGGHPYASGFKITNGKKLSEIESECISFTTELLDTYKQD